MYNQYGRKLRSLDDMEHIIDEHDAKLSLHCGNDGVLIAMLMLALATSVNDSDLFIHLNLDWKDNEFLHTVLELMRDYLQHPIW